MFLRQVADDALGQLPGLAMNAYDIWARGLRIRQLMWQQAMIRRAFGLPWQLGEPRLHALLTSLELAALRQYLERQGLTYDLVILMNLVGDEPEIPICHTKD
jgi:hypothetical protein